MKKLILTAIILFTCFAGQTQKIKKVNIEKETTKPFKTTEEEYNYLTTGYAIQISSGLDMKKGYEIYNIDSKIEGIRSAELKCLIRNNMPQKEIAAYLIIYKMNNVIKDYICIPGPNSDNDILRKYFIHLYDTPLSSEKLQLISYLISMHMQWNYATTFVEF